jgi:rRNA-processing protein FCF1
MHELRSLGPDFKASHDDAKLIELYKCGHDEHPLSPADCLLAHVGQANPDHLWVCTQDRNLREVLAGIPGAPSLFMSPNGERRGTLLIFPHALAFLHPNKQSLNNLLNR